MYSDNYSELFMAKEGTSAADVRIGTYYIRKFERVARAVYQWELPDGIDASLMEEILWRDGHALIWKSSILGLVLTRCTESGWDINGRPNRWSPQIIGGQGIELPRDLTADECVPVYDLTDPRMKRRHGLALIPRIIEISRTEGQQIRNQRTPLIAAVSNVSDAKKKKTFTRSILENDVVFFSGDYGDDVKALDLNAPFNIDKLHEVRKAAENEILEWLGVDSQAAFGKKERMIVNEQEDNDEVLNYLLRDGLEARKKAADALKRVFGLDASVKIAETVRPHDRMVSGTTGPGAPGEEQI